MATTGSVIRAGRELLGYSVQRFADAIGVSRGAVQQWENSTTAPKRALQPVVARLLGITVADLMDPPRHLRDEEVKDWLAARQRSSDPRVIDVQAREVPQPGERAALPPLGAGVMTIREALPVVLEAMRACPHREELRTLLTLLIDIDAEPYRKRLAELLDTQAVPRPPVQTKRREDAAQEDSPHANIVVGRPTGAR